MMKKLKKPKQAKVKYSQGLTLSKNYQSWRVDAGVELDCSVDPDDIKHTFSRAKKMVEEQLEHSVMENKSVLSDLSEAVGSKK